MAAYGKTGGPLLNLKASEPKEVFLHERASFFMLQKNPEKLL